MTKITTTPRAGTNSTGAAQANAPKSAPSNTPASATRQDDDTLRLAALRSMKVVAPVPFTDVRGWRVHSNDGKVVGSVTRMLVEQKPALAPRYLDVLVDPKSVGINNSSPFDLLIPIGSAAIMKGGTGISLPNLASGDMATLPRLGEGAVTWERELEVAKAFGVKDQPDSPTALYTHPQFSIATFQREHAPTK